MVYVTWKCGRRLPPSDGTHPPPCTQSSLAVHCRHIVAVCINTCWATRITYRGGSRELVKRRIEWVCLKSLDFLVYTGTVERILKWGAYNKYVSFCKLAGPGACFPRQILKSESLKSLEMQGEVLQMHCFGDCFIIWNWRFVYHSRTLSKKIPDPDESGGRGPLCPL